MYGCTNAFSPKNQGRSCTGSINSAVGKCFSVGTIMQRVPLLLSTLSVFALPVDLNDSNT